MNTTTLQRQNLAFRGTGGISPNNRKRGFCPAFRDNANGRVFLSRFANGSPAPLHVLDGLPDEVVIERGADGRPITVKQTVVAGFLSAETFYTRDQAADWLARH